LKKRGAVYRFSCLPGILRQPQIVLLETRNEMHEGTEICETTGTETDAALNFCKPSLPPIMQSATETARPAEG
jgi:hypothetical protein